MITGFAIENFKGIRDRVSLDLRPITLLFGPNSAGKSTVLHGLHYAREIFERQNLDADHTIAGGEFIDLGGFRNFVNNGDLSKSVVLRFDLNLRGRDLPSYLPPDGWLNAEKYELSEISQAVEKASIEVAVSWSNLRESLYVKYYSVGISDQPLATIRCEFDRRETYLTDINYAHPILPPLEIIDELNSMVEAGTGHVDFSRWEVERQAHALPEWGRALPLLMMTDPAFKEKADEETSRRMALGMDAIIGLFSQLIVGPGELLCEALRGFCYLGPLRATPPRNYVAPRFHEPSRWANGCAAWDLLHTNDGLVMLASNWLAGPLGVGYRLRLKQVKEIPIDSPLLVLLQSERAFDDLEDVRKMIHEFPTKSLLTLVAEDTGIELSPHDVGVGISQLVPVVVLALDKSMHLAAIEQPELHVHPAVQVGLGDLFIHLASGETGRCFLLETHSEHLMLRLLRRIRETSESELLPGHPGLRPEDVAVYYVEAEEPTNEGAEAGPLCVTLLRIDSSGEFEDRWPKGFFEERAEEIF